MFYIDKVLFVQKDFLPTTTIHNANESNNESVTNPVETVPDEIIDVNGSLPDVLLANAEATVSQSEILKPTLSQNVTIK